MLFRRLVAQFGLCPESLLTELREICPLVGLTTVDDGMLEVDSQDASRDSQQDSEILGKMIHL